MQRADERRLLMDLKKADKRKDLADAKRLQKLEEAEAKRKEKEDAVARQKRNMNHSNAAKEDLQRLREIDRLEALDRKLTRGLDSLAVSIMFGFTVFGWMIFRETRIDRLLHYLTLSPFEASPEQWVATAVMLAVVAAVSTPLILALLAERYLKPKLEHTVWYLPIRTTTWALYAVAMFVFVRQTTNDFIYFQF